MIKYTFYDDKTKANYERITKVRAFKLWQSGKEVIVCPAKLRPFGPWNPETMLTTLERAIDETMQEKLDKEHFKTAVRNFEYYNANNNEAGKFAAFYVKIGENK